MASAASLSIESPPELPCRVFGQHMQWLDWCCTWHPALQNILPVYKHFWVFCNRIINRKEAVVVRHDFSVTNNDIQTQQAFTVAADAGTFRYIHWLWQVVDRWRHGDDHPWNINVCKLSACSWSSSSPMCETKQLNQRLVINCCFAWQNIAWLKRDDAHWIDSS